MDNSDKLALWIKVTSSNCDEIESGTCLTCQHLSLHNANSPGRYEKRWECQGDGMVGGPAIRWWPPTTLDGTCENYKRRKIHRVASIDDIKDALKIAVTYIELTADETDREEAAEANRDLAYVRSVLEKCEG